MIEYQDHFGESIMPEPKGSAQLLLFEVLSDEKGEIVMILPLYRETKNHPDEIILFEVFLLSIGRTPSFVQPISNLRSIPGSRVLDDTLNLPATLVVAMLNAQKNKLTAERDVTIGTIMALGNAR